MQWGPERLNRGGFSAHAEANRGRAAVDAHAVAERARYEQAERLEAMHIAYALKIIPAVLLIAVSMHDFVLAATFAVVYGIAYLGRTIGAASDSQSALNIPVLGSACAASIGYLFMAVAGKKGAELVRSLIVAVLLLLSLGYAYVHEGAVITSMIPLTLALVVGIATFAVVRAPGGS